MFILLDVIHTQYARLARDHSLTRAGGCGCGCAGARAGAGARVRGRARGRARVRAHTWFIAKSSSKIFRGVGLIPDLYKTLGED